MAKYKIEYIALSKLKLNPNNPRFIKDDAFKRLVKSLEDCPDLLNARPCICSDRTGELIIIGGNMRFRVAQDLEYERVPVIVMKGLTEDQEKEIAIKDNGDFGEWDFDILANGWSNLPLNAWGVNMPEDWLEDNTPVGTDQDESNYSRKIEAPIYQPSDTCPKISHLINSKKTLELKKEIQESDIPEEIKDFLRAAAERHTVFNFQKIADYSLSYAMRYITR